ncbi:hypothetical protein [Melissococcus plutonius]
MKECLKKHYVRTTTMKTSGEVQLGFAKYEINNKLLVNGVTQP